MTSSEIAFLAVGLLLGVAGGAAIVVVFSSRHPTHEIRVTVTRDAIPRRASTLSAGVTRGATDGPAPGGPADRRLVDRADDIDRTPVRPAARPVVAAPILPWLAQPTAMGIDGPSAAPVGIGGPSGQPGSIAIQPEPDPLLSGLGIRRATAVADQPADPPADGVGSDDDPILPGLLAGDHRAMVRLIHAVGGPDDASRQTWDGILTRFVDAVRQRAIDLGYIDLPMGNPFWDAFTIGQCREIVLALASTGRRFDGRSDWEDGVVPAYRDLSRALADCGIDPRRIRAWPNSLEIAELFRGARVAGGECVLRYAPDLDAASLRDLLGDRDRGLDDLWAVWDAVRPALAVAPAAVG